ncbi:MAG: hypothetical protein H7145_14680 [Akkermansiaceae bacterium]|nr:hypothetical protein [Armatimonadota bacterium]
MTDPGGSDVPAAQNLIRLLYADETQETDQEVTNGAERVFEALRVRLSAVLGTGGYATLLARALALTRAEFSWMADITVDKNGSLAGRVAVAAQEQAAVEVVRSFTGLLSRFAALLVTFIGADLTNRLLDAVWQDLETRVVTDTPGVKDL